MGRVVFAVGEESMGEKKLEDADLNQWAMTALRNWKRNKPHVVRQLEANGQLVELLEEAAESAEQMYDQLVARGMSTYEALNMATREYLIFPDGSANS